MSSDLFRLTVPDNAHITAKIAAYRALLQSASTFSRPDESEDLVAFSVMSQNADLLALGTTRNSVSVQDSLEAFVRTLTDFCSMLLGPNASEQVAEFGSSLSFEASRIKDAITEIQAIFTRLLEFAFSFYPELNSLLRDRSELRLGVDIGSDLSARTVPESEKRIVELTISPARFSSANYFSIPYVLSHEFWCHVTASHVQPTTGLPPYIWAGASPSDRWEEGWMDFAQRELLRAYLEHLLGGEQCSSCISGAFDKENDAQSSSRWDPGKSLKRSEGADAARLFLKRAQALYGYGEGWNLFMSLSIAVNLVACRFDIKDSLVSCTKRFLDTKYQHQFGLSAKDEDQSLVRRRALYFEVLKRFIKLGDPQNGTKVMSEELLLQVARGWTS